MPSTSGLYNTQTIEAHSIIDAAFKRLGYSPSKLPSEDINHARLELDLMLKGWLTKGINLWTLKVAYLSLKRFQTKYNLGRLVQDITRMSLRTFDRILDGTPDTTNGGDAENAFDDNPETTCTQNAINGSISYEYTTPKVINFIGITSNVDREYSITVNAGADAGSKVPILVIPKQLYKKGQALWFDISGDDLTNGIAQSALYYDITETGGATLDIQEIYFTNNANDLTCSPIDRDTYLSYVIKSTEGRPTVYYFDRQIGREVNVWTSPAFEYKVMQYSFVQPMQDVGDYFNTFAVPSDFYPALLDGLCWKLCSPFKPDQDQKWERTYQMSLDMAFSNNTEKRPLIVKPDFSKYQ